MSLLIRHIDGKFVLRRTRFSGVHDYTDELGVYADVRQAADDMQKLACAGETCGLDAGSWAELQRVTGQDHNREATECT